MKRWLDLIVVSTSVTNASVKMNLFVIPGIIQIAALHLAVFEEAVRRRRNFIRIAVDSEEETTDADEYENSDNAQVDPDTQSAATRPSSPSEYIHFLSCLINLLGLV